MPVAAIKTADVREMLDKIQARGALTYARDVRVKAAYLDSEFLKDRTRMMTAWADYLDAAERDAMKVVSLRKVKTEVGCRGDGGAAEHAG